MSNLSEQIKQFIKEILIVILFLVVILSVVKPVVVNGDSMRNTFSDKDFLIINKLAFSKYHNIEHGDVIVFNQKEPEDRMLIKRVIAVEGDFIEITDGFVYVNGEVINEDYIKDSATDGEIAKFEIPSDKLFVMGDNRQDSSDSRYDEVGLVDTGDVIGEPVLRLYPISNIGAVD